MNEQSGQRWNIVHLIQLLDFVLVMMKPWEACPHRCNDFSVLRLNLKEGVGSFPQEKSIAYNLHKCGLLFDYKKMVKVPKTCKNKNSKTQPSLLRDEYWHQCY